MASSPPCGGNLKSQEDTGASRRKTIPASKVDVTLTISDKAMRDIEKSQEKTIEAAQQARKFAWR